LPSAMRNLTKMVIIFLFDNDKISFYYKKEMKCLFNIISQKLESQPTHF
jgi:GTP1/Obg family GTP-binding protein